MKKINGAFAMVLVLAGAAAFGFRPLFELLKDQTALQFASAAFGTIFAATITMVLLNKQTQVEQEKDRDQRVFEERLKLFNEVLDRFSGIVEDGVIDAAEVKALQFMSMRIAMLGSDEIIEKYTGLYKKIAGGPGDVSGAKSEDIIVTPDILSELIEMSLYFRKELGLSHADAGQIQRVFQKMDQTNQALQNKVGGRINYITGGKDEWLGVQKERGLEEPGQLALKVAEDIHSEVSKKFTGIGPLKFTQTAISFVTLQDSGKEKNCFYINMSKSPKVRFWATSSSEEPTDFPSHLWFLSTKYGYAITLTTEEEYLKLRSIFLKHFVRAVELVKSGKDITPIIKKEGQID